MREPCRSDQRADIFSYGVVLWELITQERPERGALRDFKVNMVTLVHYKQGFPLSKTENATTSSQA